MKKVFIAIGIIFVMVVFASVHTQAQEIYGCVAMKDGKVRIVDEISECNLKKENPISWNATGNAGTACWDLNENQGCDLPDEDKNADGICDALDCQGAPGQGCPKVYDSSDPPQYLEIFIGYTPRQQTGDGLVDLVQIFIPELKKLTYISLNATDVWQKAGDIFANSVFYNEASCTASPIIDYSYIIVRDYIGNLYYSENQRTLIPFLYERDSTGCHATSGERSAFLSEIFEETIPFTLPVTLPLQFDYGG